MAQNVQANAAGTALLENLPGAVLGGTFAAPQLSNAQQTVAGSGTITLPTGGCALNLTTGGNVTGIILTAGTVDGQILILFNVSANSITFAAKATSNVADGTSSVIAGNNAAIFYWNAALALWFKVKA